MAEPAFLPTFPDISNTDLTVVSSFNILKIIYMLSRKSSPTVMTYYPNYNALFHFSHCAFLAWIILG